MKIVAVRFTPATLHQMIISNPNFINDEYYWRTATHFVFHGLCYDYSGLICAEPVGETVLNHPLTYIPWIAELQQRWPHIQVVWALPPLPDDILVDMKWAFANIEEMVRKYKIDVIEFNFVNFQSPTLEDDMKTLAYEMKEIPCKFWGVLPAPALQLNIENVQNFVEYFVINSFGFFGDIRIETEFSNSRLAFQMAVRHYNLLPSKVLIGIDTTGLIRNSKITRIIPYHAIEQKKQLMILHRNYGCASSYLENSKETIYYDDEYVLHQKLLLQHTHGFPGIIVSDLVDDLPARSLGGIWTMVTAYTFMQRNSNIPS